MATKLAFDRIQRINERYKQLVSSFIRTVHDLSIPESIALVTLLFYYNILESSILTDEENDKLLYLFDEQNKFQDLGNYSYKLVYKRTRDGVQENDFKDKCHDKKNLLCIIWDQNNNVFGGYTSIGWKGRSQLDHYVDNKAFIFIIRSIKNYEAKIFNAIKGKKAIRIQYGYYCMFGSNTEIWMDYKTVGVAPFNDFEPPSNRKSVTGATVYEDCRVKEVEVYQLESQQ